jgi:hypothetical protein
VSSSSSALVVEDVVDGVLFSSPFCLLGLLLVGMYASEVEFAIKH